MNKSVYEEKVKTAPLSPGCYIWKDVDRDILYIGKAVNLRYRSSSYFNNYDRLDPKIRSMVDQIEDVDYYTVDTEVEALILETNLIKKYKPKYNRLMKDDKNYSWLMVDWYHPYPSMKIVREMKDKRAEYYGPYPQRFPVFKVLRSLRKVFPYCNHLPRQLTKTPPTPLIKGEIKPCFNYHIGLCSGVCGGLVTKDEHRKNIKGIRDFFKGKKLDMIDELKVEMQTLSVDMNYEEAAQLRDKIQDLEYVTQHIKIDKDIDEVLLMEMKKSLRERALEDLIGRLSISRKTQTGRSYKIECYDISNIQGTNAVGSMVVFVDGKPEKKLYRKFKIKTKTTPDDFHMMREVLERRLKYLIPMSSLRRQGPNLPEIDSRLRGNDKKKKDTRIQETNKQQTTNKKQKIDESFSVKPDLIIVDGGKGQLSSGYKILKDMGLENEINIVGLAKREEEIFKIIDDEKTPWLGVSKSNFKKYKLPKRSESLYLVQRIRDEAHRFAIGYHRRLRAKGQTKSILDDIPGVGDVTKKQLIEAFGGVEGIKKTSRDDISTVVRSAKTVDSICKVLKIKK